MVDQMVLESTLVLFTKIDGPVDLVFDRLVVVGHQFVENDFRCFLERDEKMRGFADTSEDETCAVPGGDEGSEYEQPDGNPGHRLSWSL